MKRFFCAVCAMFLLPTQSVSAGCTYEELQNRYSEMATALEAFAERNADKFNELDCELEQMFGHDVDAFDNMAQDQIRHPEHKQKAIDFGCDLYGRMAAEIKKRS